MRCDGVMDAPEEMGVGERVEKRSEKRDQVGRLEMKVEIEE